MRKHLAAALLILVLATFVAVLAIRACAPPAGVHCPEHGYASCYFTGETEPAADGKLLYKFHCSCGDDWWVRGPK